MAVINLALVIIILIATIRIVPESNGVIVERLGNYNRTMHADFSRAMQYEQEAQEAGESDDE